MRLCPQAFEITDRGILGHVNNQLP